MKCKVCDLETEQIFNIYFKAIPLCKMCEYKIVMQSITYKYKITVKPSKGEKA